jgi:hypothetical protein
MSIYMGTVYKLFKIFLIYTTIIAKVLFSTPGSASFQWYR